MATQKKQDYKGSKTDYKTLCNIRKLTLLPFIEYKMQYYHCKMSLEVRSYCLVTVYKHTPAVLHWLLAV